MDYVLNCENEGTAKVLEGPIRGWQEIADKSSPDDLRRITEELEGLSQYLARAAGYFHARDLGQDHRLSVVRSNRTIKAIQEELGFTYPKNDLSF